jgi:hypothetical protein
MLLNRRHRHFNPASAGAGVALDARTLTGLADGDPVSSWSRAGSITLTASGGARPTYKVAIQGGQPTVRFDGIANWMQNAAAFTSSKDVTFMFLCKITSSGLTVLFTNGGAASNGQTLYQDSGSFVWLHGGVGNIPLGVAAPSTVSLLTISELQTASQAARLWIDGTEQTTTATATAILTPSGVTTSGSAETGLLPMAVDQYAVIGFGTVISAALRRRIEQSLAFSFRIACA